MSHTYRGHRASSFEPVDITELVELRARQRTFHGAYSRTALGSLGYALTILRLFDKRFYKIGLLFAILGAMMFILAFLRSRHSTHDFADYDAGNEVKTGRGSARGGDLPGRAENQSSDEDEEEDDEDKNELVYRKYRYGTLVYRDVVKTVGQTGKRVFGRPFVSAGWIVASVTGVVLAVEIGLFVLVLRV